MQERVCAALLRDGGILMVRHEHDGRAYWRLPGGGVEPGEPPDQEVAREVREEVELHGRVVRLLYEQVVPGDRARKEYCYLVATAAEQEPTTMDGMILRGAVAVAGVAKGSEVVVSGDAIVGGGMVVAVEQQRLCCAAQEGRMIGRHYSGQGCYCTVEHLGCVLVPSGLENRQLRTRDAVTRCAAGAASSPPCG